MPVPPVLPGAAQGTTYYAWKVDAPEKLRAGAHHARCFGAAAPSSAVLSEHGPERWECEMEFVDGAGFLLPSAESSVPNGAHEECEDGALAAAHHLESGAKETMLRARQTVLGLRNLR